MNGELPKFGQISYSLIVRATVFLKGNLLRSEYFDEHLHCYVVCETDESFFVHPGNLRNFGPLHLNRYAAKTVIIPRNYIM